MNKVYTALYTPLLIFTAAILFVYNSCTVDLAGGSSEIGNGRVAGVIATTDGKPSTGATIQLIPTDYIPFKAANDSDVYRVSSEQNGRFVFDKVDSGEYNLEAIGDSGQVFLRNIHVVSGQNIDLGTQKLLKAGSLIVNLPDLLVTSSSIIFMKGTSYRRTGSTLVRTGQGFLLDSLPAGVTLPSILAVPDSLTSDEELVAEEPLIRESVILPAQYLAWRHYSVVHLLTGNPIFVDNNHSGFPLLVRLDTNNFDFLSCKSDGSDIRTIDEEGRILPRELEYLDIPNRKGALWVALELLDGNSDDQKIVLLWGNAAVSSFTQGTVFDTSHGFCGVWHFGDALGSRIFTDATYNHNNVNDSTSTTGRVGIIGLGKNINGNNDRVIAGAVPMIIADNQFTVSLWFKVESVADTTKRILVSTRDISKNVQNMSISVRTTTTQDMAIAIRFSDTVTYQAKTPADTMWHSLSVTSDNGTVSFYVDGQLNSKTVEDIPRDNTPKSLQLIIGGGDGVSFRGAIDEVRVERVARPYPWIWYSFDSQRTNSAMFHNPVN